MIIENRDFKNLTEIEKPKGGKWLRIEQCNINCPEIWAMISRLGDYDQDIYPNGRGRQMLYDSIKDRMEGYSISYLIKKYAFRQDLLDKWERKHPLISPEVSPQVTDYFWN